MDWGDMVSRAKNEVIDDLAVIVAGKQLWDRIAFLQAEIARIEVPRAQAVEDRDLFKEQWEAELTKYNRQRDKFDARFRGAVEEREREAREKMDKPIREQGRKCMVLSAKFGQARDSVIIADKKLKALREELRRLKLIRVPEPKHLDLLRGVLNGKPKKAR